MSESSLELEIELDGAIRSFILKPQHGTTSEEEAETVESETDGTRQSRLGNRSW